jgi:Trk K+ transport system NAD-binding subunit
MRVLVIGAGQTGVRVIQQLRKNPEIKVLTADPRPDPRALRDGLIDRVDVTDVITPLTLEEVLKRTAAELVFLALTAEEMSIGTAPGGDILADALLEEIASIASVPVIQVARSAA